MLFMPIKAAIKDSPEFCLKCSDWSTTNTIMQDYPIKAEDVQRHWIVVTDPKT